MLTSKLQRIKELTEQKEKIDAELASLIGDSDRSKRGRPKKQSEGATETHPSSGYRRSREPRGGPLVLLWGARRSALARIGSRIRSTDYRREPAPPTLVSVEAPPGVVLVSPRDLRGHHAKFTLCCG